jgi:hypothetical protein
MNYGLFADVRIDIAAYNMPLILRNAMKFRCFVIVMMVIFPVVSSKALKALQGENVSKAFIEYQSPINGDTYVPARTTIVVRPYRTIISGHSAQDFSFDVRGELSGNHPGKIIISDDNATVIFKPYQPFALNERVDVAFSISGSEKITLASYSFRITPLSDEERIRRFKLFRESEGADNIRSLREVQANGNDTSHSYDFLIDTIIPSKVAPGDIFTTRNDGGNSFIVNLDNTASIIYQYEVFSPPSENFRPWNNKVFSYNYQAKVFILDSIHNPIDTFLCGNGYKTDDHEFQLLPNGHALMMAYDDRDTDMRLVTGDTNAASHAILIGSIIQELDLKKNVVFEWKTWGHLDIKDVLHVNLIKPNPRLVEYSHLNSIEMDNDGNIIASFRSMSDIVKIDRKTGDIIWQWGGKKNMFSFIGDTLPFSYQHDVRRIPNGHITMFDNGPYHTTKWADGTYHDTAWSRAIEYELDETNHTAKAVWQYSGMDFTVSAGSAQRLPNGNTFICSGPFGVQKITEVTPEGEKVFEMKFPAGAFSYRALRFPQPNSPLSVIRLPDAANFFELQSIYPNPAQNSVTIHFSTLSKGDVEIDIVDVLGQVVLKEDEKLFVAGSYSIGLDLKSLPSGIYYCKLTQGGNSLVKELVIQK